MNEVQVNESLLGPVVLVTGHLGKLGGLTFELLKEQGYEMRGFDVRAGRDILNEGQLAESMRCADFVVHCAGLPHPNKGPFEHYFKVNIQGTMNVVRAAAQAGVKRVIYIGSTGWYGCDVRKGRIIPAYFPIDEGHPQASVDGRSEGMLDEYNQSKVIAEEILAYYGRAHKVEVVVLRSGPANPKSHQYHKFDWEMCNDWRRGCLFTNTTPETVATAVLKAIEHPGPFWYEVFLIVDKYTHESVDMPAFLEMEYPEAPRKGRWGKNSCAFTSKKAQDVLGWRPHEGRR